MSELDKAFAAILKSARQAVRQKRYTTKLQGISDPMAAEKFLRSLHWKKSRLSPPWLMGSVTDVSAPIGRGKIQEAYRLFDIGPRRPPKPGWQLTLYKHKFPDFSARSMDIVLINRGGKFEIQLGGSDFYDIFPWLS